MEKEFFVFESMFHTQGMGRKRIRKETLSLATKLLEFCVINGVYIYRASKLLMMNMIEKGQQSKVY